MFQDEFFEFSKVDAAGYYGTEVFTLPHLLQAEEEDDRALPPDGPIDFPALEAGWPW